VNRLGTTLQHLFNARVTKVAGFLRPTSPWLMAVVHAAQPKLLPKEFPNRGFGRIAQGPMGRCEYGSRNLWNRRRDQPL